MKYLGNYRHLVSNIVIEKIIKNIGDVRPTDTTQNHQSEVYKKWVEAGYDIKKLRWEFYDHRHLGNDINLPFDQVYHWWFSKLNPGDMFPMHVDSYSDNIKLKRFWMAYQDYQPGHIFTYADKILTNYQAGDLFEFEDNQIWHGAVNIGFLPKISLQIATNIAP